MKYFKIFTRTVFILALLSVVSISTVAATWAYSKGAISNATAEIIPGFFEWEGSSTLPNDQVGENHRALIDTIINGATTDNRGNVIELGLNYPNSYLSEEISDRTNGGWFATNTLGSMDFWEKSNIENYFELSTDNLTFVIYFPNGEGKTYYLYTTSLVLGAQNAPNFPIGTNIYPIYRTTLEKNAAGEYEATKSEVGYAPSAYYSNPLTGSILVKYPSFDPSKWKAEDLGTNLDTAIYTYVGETQTAYPLTSSTLVYYKLPEIAAQTKISISTSNLHAKINIYDNSGSLINLDSGTQGGYSLTFTTKNNKQYYFTVSGDYSIHFVVSKL